MKKTVLIIAGLILILSLFGENGVMFDSNNSKMNNAFKWAKKQALSFVHDGSDPVGYWYEAALPKREAFCMRDVSHQVIGAEILGLGKYNYNMFHKFAENISESKDYCSYWEINRYNKPAPVDYENDKDFWYNLPANFDVVFNAERLYRWTGNRKYVTDADFSNFYKLSMNEYVRRWQLDCDNAIKRDRNLNVVKSNVRFGNRRGIPTYNEGGRAETLLGIDMTASLLAAYKSYSNILKYSGDDISSKKYLEKAKAEEKFLNDFWWDNMTKSYRSIWYADRSFDYFNVGKHHAYLHYALYFNAISDSQKKKNLIKKYVKNYSNLIVELKSYLPIIFYENGYEDLANSVVLELCDKENHRRNYPENSFTIIEDFTRGLMGINANSFQKIISTISRLQNKDWAEMKNISILSNKIYVKHFGKYKTILKNQSGDMFFWRPQFKGKFSYITVDGEKKRVEYVNGCSSCLVEVKPNETFTASVER